MYREAIKMGGYISASKRNYSPLRMAWGQCGSLDLYCSRLSLYYTPPVLIGAPNTRIFRSVALLHALTIPQAFFVFPHSHAESI
jgi:hypothetical protein